MDSFELEIKKDFLAEAKDLLANTEQCFLILEKSPDDFENLNQIFRLAHNLKGSSGAVGFAGLSDFTHKLENLLIALKERRVALNPAVVDLLLRANDYLVSTVEILLGDVGAGYENPTMTQELIAAANGEYAGADAAASAEREGTSAEPIGGGAPTGSEPVDTMPASSGDTTLKISRATNTAKNRDENIRVSLARIEQLLNNVGELSILQAVMNEQSVAMGPALPPLMRETLSSMAKIIKETQSLSMSLRMLPVKQTFQKMERLVRDTSRALGKTVEFHMSGEETEVDKTVLEALADPLVHIIRNAVDHGLESIEDRLASGKPETGHVHLSAYHRAGQVMIEIRDDGKGLNAENLVKKAKSKGLIAEDAQLTTAEAHQLIFMPGFSTKENVTDVSGRGVGMDVVKTSVTALKGQVEIETEIGKGTCFRIGLPLTLAIIDSVIVIANSQRYVIPLSQISEFFRPAREDVNTVLGKDELINLREESMPGYRLPDLIAGRKLNADKPAWDYTALIIRDGTNLKSAILVDSIVAQQQVVIKQLSAESRGKVGVMGSAILGDGKPALILDLIDMMKAMAPPRANSQRRLNSRMEAA